MKKMKKNEKMKKNHINSKEFRRKNVGEKNFGLRWENYLD